MDPCGPSFYRFNSRAEVLTVVYWTITRFQSSCDISYTVKSIHSCQIGTDFLFFV